MPFYFSLSATFSLRDCHPHQLFFHPSLRSLPILIVVCPFSCGLQLLRLSALFGSQSPFIRTELPVHIILVLTMFPVGMNRITISSLGSLILLLYTLFATVILRTQLLSQTCNFCCCWSVGATVSRLCRQAGVKLALRTFPFNHFDIS